MIKKCSSCKKYKFKWKYNKNRTKRDGLQHQCRPCQHEYHNKQWYPKNKKDRLKSVKKYKWERRQDNYRRVIKEYFVKVIEVQKGKVEFQSNSISEQQVGKNMYLISGKYLFHLMDKGEINARYSTKILIHPF